MNYIVSIHATQIVESTFEATWTNEPILDGEDMGSMVVRIEEAESIQDVWATISNELKLNAEESEATLNLWLLDLYNRGNEASNTIALITQEIVLSITIIEVENA